MRPGALRAALATAATSLLAGGFASAALSQEAAGVSQLVGTLQKIKATRTIAIGYRTASLPFSYLNAAGQPIGYSIDICQEIVKDVRAELGVDAIQMKYLPVDTQTRISSVVDGAIDLECGTTTNTTERQKQVSFSPIIFVSGTKLAVKRSSHFRSYRDLKGHAVAVTPASTNEAAIEALNANEGLNIRILQVASNIEAFEAVAADRADAWAGDDAVLFAAIAESGNPRDFKVLDEFLSYDPYGIMYRKNDPEFGALVKHTFDRLAHTRELARIYEQWFQRKLPSGRILGIAMSPQLESIFESLGQPTE
jgi:glutamate/aspartate transport system substrate-binding protein